MKSIKLKLMLSILVLTVAASLITVTIGVSKGFGITEDVIEKQFESKIIGANNMLKVYLEEQFGSLRLNKDGKLSDEKDMPIDNRFEYIDKLANNMGVVATVFVKEGDGFTRVLTTVKDDGGNRVVGTELDKNGKAYEEIQKGNTYFGEADILGKPYMTGYAPMYNRSGEMIGIYFAGVPLESIIEIVNDGISSTIKAIAFLIVLVLLISGIITYFIAESISKPVNKVTKAAVQIAEGNFDVELTLKSKDEIGQLANAFNLTIDRLLNYQGYIDEISDAMLSISKGNLVVELNRDYEGQFKKLKDNLQALLGGLNSMILQFDQSTEQIDSSASQVSSGAQALSQGATEQASTIEELSASIADFANQIRESAENAKLAREKTEIAGKEISESNQHMEDMISAMDKITLKSSEISKIIKIIEDIAFQTNILALNAAVEAARAGQAGKGFAVVADEVRNLAGKSAEAAKNTNVLISETVEAVESGAKTADNTAQSLLKSAEITKESIELIDKIAKAADDEALAIEQIDQGIEQISSVVQTNAATAEENAAASEEFSSQASILKGLIAEFNLNQ